MATNSVNTDWNSVLSTAQAGLAVVTPQIDALEVQQAPLRKAKDDALAALNAQRTFYQQTIEQYRPRPSLSEILYLEDAWKADPNNAAKKAAWDKAYATFQQQSKVLEEKTSGLEGIIMGLQQQYSNANDRFMAVFKQIPPLAEKEYQYKQQIAQAQAALGTQAKGTTPATTSTVSATTVPASSKPGNASIATTTTTTTTIQSSNKSSETVTKTTTVTTGSDPATPTAAPTSITSAYKAPPPIDSSLEGSPEFIAQQQAEAAKPVPLAIATIDDTPLVSTDQINADIANIQITPPEIEVEPDYAEIYSAESQATEQDQANFAAKADWRVRLSLAPDSQYLYNDPEYAGILKPLKETDGVIFPYTPSITVNYAANYEATNIVHSNYKIYQYSGSAVEQVTIACDFTCQDTYEANYLLSVIHFFRSMTKMFYGQDTLPKNGTPPPLCYMFGMGGYQFAAHPLAISGFSYNLPADVDYIKTTSASPAGSPVPNTADVSATRLAGTNVGKGGTGPGPKFNTGIGNETVTWVPTKIQLSITCLPIMSRNAISNQFSLRRYGSGDLVLGTRKLGGGMW